MFPSPIVARSSEPLTTAAPVAAAAMPTPHGRRKRQRVDEDARHGFNLYFLAPVILILVSAMIALVGGTLWLTTLQNRAEGIKESERVKASLVARVAAVEATTKVFAVWDDAAQNLVAKFDRVWADANIGAYVYYQNGIETTFVVNQSGQSLYGYIDGKRSALDPAAVLGAGYSAAYSRVALGRRALDEAISGISISGRGTAIFSIVKIRPHGTTLRVRADVNRYIVMAKFIDKGVLRELARDANGAALAFTYRFRPGLSNWTFAAFDGQGTRTFSWRPDEPGTRLLYRAIPWLTLLIGLMGLLAGLILTRARKAARELVASETKALYLARRDSLTGLPNRRSFAEHLLDLRRRGERHSILFLDLDGFKRVNDTFGHGVGDKVLCRTAERLQRVLAPATFLARLGGDEFAVTLPVPASAPSLTRFRHG